MKRIFSIVITGLILVGCGAVKKNNDLAINLPISASIDLTKVVNDKAPVIINPGRFTTDTVTYRLPKVVQGTYAVSDFGKYIDDFKAFSYKGDALEVNKIDTNTWSISDAINLDYIIYNVNDTFDVEVSGGMGGEVPFSPAGTNLEPDNYVLNLHGFIGYFDILKNNQYKLDVTAAADFSRTSALQQVGSTTSPDGETITSSYFAPRYFDVTDNPMMYGKLEVEEFKVGDISIVLSVYSPNKTHSAKSLKETMFNMMKAQKAYLGDVNSTARYDIYVYLSEGKETSPKGFGALEHHTSTVVVMPEAMPEAALAKSMTDIVSHEFFHIVTPLSVHSEDVHYFDYKEPTFSKHLWMYEGVTEYFASLFQIDQGLVGEEEFYNKIMGKIKSASRFNDAMSFTEMSENILDNPFAPNYGNVYQKGALIGMCLDILIREGSNGNRGILSLMKELSLKYGKNKPFDDELIIDEIVAMTYPSIRQFFDDHVIGNTPIDYNAYFNKVGLCTSEAKIKANYLMIKGQPIVSLNQQNGTVIFNNLVNKNSFWRDEGVEANDVVKSIDGQSVSIQNANQIFQGVFSWAPGQEVEIILNRGEEEIVIKTTLKQAYTKGEGLNPLTEATKSQIELRNAWLKG